MADAEELLRFFPQRGSLQISSVERIGPRELYAKPCCSLSGPLSNMSRDLGAAVGTRKLSCH